MSFRLGWILVPLLLAAVPVQADEPKKPEPETKRSHVLPGGKIPTAREDSLLERDLAPNRPSWLSAVEIDKKSGFAMRQPLHIGGHPVELGLKGPVMKRKRLGVAVEIRF